MKDPNQLMYITEREWSRYHKAQFWKGFILGGVATFIGLYLMGVYVFGAN